MDLFIIGILTFVPAFITVGVGIYKEEKKHQYRLHHPDLYEEI